MTGAVFVLLLGAVVGAHGVAVMNPAFIGFGVLSAIAALAIVVWEDRTTVRCSCGGEWPCDPSRYQAHLRGDDDEA